MRAVSLEGKERKREKKKARLHSEGGRDATRPSMAGRETNGDEQSNSSQRNL